MARNINTSAETLAELAKDEFNCVRLAVAEHRHTPEETLTELAKEEDAYICCAVARNVNTPAETLARLAKEEDFQIRWWVARNPSTPVEVLKRLANDVYEDLRVRKVAAATKREIDLLSQKMSVDAVSPKTEKRTVKAKI